MALLPTPDLPPEVEAVNTEHRRSGCIDSDRDMDFMAGSDQRAELWLRDDRAEGHRPLVRLQLPDRRAAGAGGR